MNELLGQRDLVFVQRSAGAAMPQNKRNQQNRQHRYGNNDSTARRTLEIYIHR